MRSVRFMMVRRYARSLPAASAAAPILSHPYG